MNDDEHRPINGKVYTGANRQNYAQTIRKLRREADRRRQNADAEGMDALLKRIDDYGRKPAHD